MRVARVVVEGAARSAVIQGERDGQVVSVGVDGICVLRDVARTQVVAA